MATPEDRLKRLIDKHNGCLSAMCRDVNRGLKRRGKSITRQGLGLQLEKHGLLEAAAAARTAAGIPGRRKGLTTPEAEAKEREEILAALAAAPSDRAAVKALPFSRTQLFRKMRQHGITQVEITNARQRSSTGT